MNTPLDASTPTQVELLCLTANGPIMFEGRARLNHEESTEIEVDLSGPASDDVAGSQAIVTFPDKQSPRLTAKVLRADGNRLSLSAPRLRPRDKRLYPRLYGNIPLRYRLHNPEDGELTIHRWLAGSTQDLTPRPWRSPEPFMNFSVNGLCFEDSLECREGDLLLLHMGVGDGESRWRATGRIVRVKDLPMEGDTPIYSIALSFETLPDDAMDALSDFTLTIQEALL
ncbi:MAG: hypothetical protein AAFV53_09480 [Myxococcota bacterium]